MKAAAADSAWHEALHFGNPGGAVVGWLLVTLFLALGALGIREALRLPTPGKRAAAATLRSATALFACLIAVQPQWVEQEVKQIEGRLAVLLDVSRSMAVRHDASGPVDKDNDDSRLARALQRIKPLFEKSQAGVDLYAFGSDAKPARLFDITGRSSATEDDTRIADAVRSIASDHGDALGAVLVVSDGADQQVGFDGTGLKDLGIRVHTAAIGQESSARDDAIRAVQADAHAFLREPGLVEVGVRSSQPGGTRMVSLRHEGELVAEASVELDAEGNGKVSLPFTPMRIGRAVYSVSLPVDAADAVPENNERAFLVRVARDRLRVLLVCGSPTWDTRFLRAFLKADPSIDLITFFILRTGSDLSMAAPEELSLIPFPTDELFREHLDSFDLVIFQDFDHGPYQLARYLGRISQYVRDGGGFAMVGGVRSFGAGGYHATPIDEVLPVDAQAGAQAWLETELVPGLVESTSAHPIVELAPDAAENLAAWQRLAPLIGANLLGAPRKGAHVLLTHPTEKSADGRPMPLLAVGPAGKGRVLALGADSTYRWGITTAGLTGDASAYERFWDRALRWLARDPRLDPARIETDRERYGPNAALEAKMNLRSDDYRPVADRAIEVAVVDNAGVERQVARVQSDVEGRATAKLNVPTDPGGYRLLARRPREGGGGGDDEVLAEEGFIVEEGGDELADPRPRHALLQKLARETGGEYFDLGAALELDELERTRGRTLGSSVRAPFSSAWALALLVALFVLEWFLRRAWGLR
jgi:uncharacterized membrane protein